MVLKTLSEGMKYTPETQLIYMLSQHVKGIKLLIVYQILSYGNQGFACHVTV